MRRALWSAVLRCLPIGLAALLAAPALSPAQPTGASAPRFKPAQLEQIAAPIALYPDPLLAHIMMASTYPLDVVEAARFASANPNLRDAALDRELQQFSWDDSVKALVHFPKVLEMMHSQLEWLHKLGDAVLAQQKDTMAAIQRLRARALRAGTLKSSEEQTVIVEGAPPQTIIRIDPVNPEIVYVPTYDPTVIYGDWPYPAYPPYYYYPPYYPVGSAGITFAFGMLVGGAIWGGCNWRHGHIFVHVDGHSSFHHSVNRGVKIISPDGERGGSVRGRVMWQHNPEHRRGPQGRDLAIQQRFDRAGGATTAPRSSVRDGSVSASTFPGHNVSASTFPRNNVSVSTFPANNVSVSTFPGNNASGSTFRGGDVSGKSLSRGGLLGGMRGGGWGRR